MKTVTRTVYIAADNREFNTEADCLRHEAKITEAARILEILPPAIQKFRNPETEFLQHEMENFERFRQEMIAFSMDHADPEFRSHFQECQRYNHPYFPLRLADDMDHFRSDAYRKGCYRIHCTDMNYREWEQPYYAYEANKKITTERENAAKA